MTSPESVVEPYAGTGFGEERPLARTDLNCAGVY